MLKKTNKIYLIALFALIFACFILPGKAKASYGDTITWLSQLYAGDGGNAKYAYLDFPEGMTKDSSGNFYIADTWNNVIRKIDASTNIITTLAGNGSYGYKEGLASSAQFAQPHDLVVDSNGIVYVADTENNRIRKIVNGYVSSLPISGLNKPEGIEIHPTSNDYLYIADTGNNVIKEYQISTNRVSRVWTGFLAPTDLDFEMGAGDWHIYVADSGHHQVKGINIDTNSLAVIAGSGERGYQEASEGTQAQFDQLKGIVVDKDSHSLFVSDRLASQFRSMIRKIDYLGSHATSLVADDTGMVNLDYPRKLVIKGDYLYVLNKGIGTIQKFRKSDGYSEYPGYLVAGAERFQNRNGKATESLIARPWDMAVSPDKAYLYLAENNKISRIRLSDGYREWIVGDSIDQYRNLKGKEARFNNITGITISPDGNYLYVVDRGNHRIRGVRLSDGQTFLVSGGGLIQRPHDYNGYQEGLKEEARFTAPGDLCLSHDGNYLYVTDTGNNRIRKVRISDGQTWLVAGSGKAGLKDGPGLEAQFYRPFGIDIDSKGEYLFIADSFNHVIRKVRISDGYTVTIAGAGRPGYQDGFKNEAYFSIPEYIHFGKDGYLYVSEANIRRIDLSTGLTLTIIKGRGYKDGAYNIAQVNTPKGIIKFGDYLFIADHENDVIRKIDISGEIKHFLPCPSPSIEVLPTNQFRPSFNNGLPFHIKIKGSNFSYGIKVWFNDIPAVKVFFSLPTEIVVIVPFDKMKTGLYDIVLQTLDGQKVIIKNAFVVTNPDGSLPPKPAALPPVAKSIVSFFAFQQNFKGGVHLATGDLDGDGIAEIVVGAGPGGGPHVRVFKSDGKFLMDFFPFHPKFSGGVDVACGDVDGDGRDEIGVVQYSKGQAWVKVYKYNKARTILGQWNAFGKFEGGGRVAMADLDGDKKAEIIVGAGAGGGPHVRVFRSNGAWTGWDIFPFHPKFSGGVTVAAGDVDGDGKDEIGVCQASKGEAWCKVYKYNKARTILGQFRAYPAGVECGADIEMADISGDGKAEVITGAGLGGGPQVRVFSGSGQYKNIGFFAFHPLFPGGVYVAAQDLDKDRKAEIIAGAGPGGGPHLRVFEPYHLY